MDLVVVLRLKSCIQQGAISRERIDSVLISQMLRLQQHSRKSFVGVRVPTSLGLQRANEIWDSPLTMNSSQTESTTHWSRPQGPIR